MVSFVIEPKVNSGRENRTHPAESKFPVLTRIRPCKRLTCGHKIERLYNSVDATQASLALSSAGNQPLSIRRDHDAASGLVRGPLGRHWPKRFVEAD